MKTKRSYSNFCAISSRLTDPRYSCTAVVAEPRRLPSDWVSRPTWSTADASPTRRCSRWSRLQALGCDALGLTGADANIILSHKRPPVAVAATTSDGSPSGTLVDFGFVGDVDQAAGAKIAHFIEAGLVPVIAPLTHDGQGHMLNTNADTMASETAKAMAAAGYDVTLIFAFEKPGVLRDANDDTSVIATINRADFLVYKADGTISGGMLPKIENALAAVDAGVSRVIITLATAIDGHHGTIITR